jgi:hypothetical protein
MTTADIAGAVGRGHCGSDRIADARPQSRVALAGVIGEVQTLDAGSGPACRCVLDDGTGQVDLLFLGRTAVAGLTTGTRCGAGGVVTVRRGRLAIWNPWYQIEAGGPVRAVRPPARPAQRRPTRECQPCRNK